MSRKHRHHSRSGEAAPSLDREKLRAARQEVQAIYKELADRPVERDCQGRTECCRFRLTGRTPQLTKGEAVVAASGWRAAGRKEVPQNESTDGACPFLGENGHCQIYEERPFGCRTHFCAAAGGVLERASLIDLIRRLESIDEALQGDGPKPLRTAVEAVWDEIATTRKRRS